jgi:hypothetical protein
MPKEVKQKSGIAVGINAGHVSDPPAANRDGVGENSLEMVEADNIR